jgi:hypothetical protein
MEVEVQWQHELRKYPTIVLTWEDATRGAIREYFEKYEEALIEYDFALIVAPNVTEVAGRTTFLTGFDLFSRPSRLLTGNRTLIP